MNSLANRRSFLRALTFTAAATTSRGLAAAPAQLQPDATGGIQVIDTHTHFYDPTRPQGVPWPPKTDALLYRRVMPPEYRDLPQPHPVSGTVVIEASAWIEDNQWLLDLAAEDAFLVGIVGHLPAGRPEFADLLKRFSGQTRFLGIRISGNRLREAGDSTRFHDDLRRLTHKDLSLDLLGGGTLPSDTARLAERHPQLRMVIDHLAAPRIAGEPPDRGWRAQMAEAASHPNIYCKVSGLVEGTGRPGAAPREGEVYRETLDVARELFGPRRLIYGSNWPVSARFAPVGVVQRIAWEYFEPLGQTVLRQVFHDNAAAVYRWPSR